MASATARPIFTFHLHKSHPHPSTTKQKSHITVSPPHLRNSPTPPLNGPPKLQFTCKSVDITKDDKPIFEPDSTSNPKDAPLPEEEKLDKRRLEERFAILNTGIYECQSCGYRYDEATGDLLYPTPPGLQFDKLPEDWRCPTCGAAKSFFESKSVEIAGFAQNQQFGLGANALTSGQKLVIIYGSLFFFFVLFLSGYFLQ
ncbi:Rubredoxin-like domain [Macleaya cordata]|uniref:Rubredoxin-like domain n=1 Tax=Macleaya cordata TaxID=56857 RepID=A0A200QSR4_MACCD|nr:Rubredoxin-like domain [Macleaya cordata]